MFIVFRVDNFSELLHTKQQTFVIVYMSVFIQIKQAIIEQETLSQYIALKIKSKDTELDIAPQETHTTTPLNHSLISSIKEKQLTFILTLLNQDQQPLYTLTNELSFSPLYLSPEKQLSQSVQLGQHIRLNIDIFYTKKKNFIGPIDFYEYQIAPSSTIVISHLQQVEVFNIPVEDYQALSDKDAPHLESKINKPELFQEKEDKTDNKDRGLFFCCGEMVDDRKYEIEDEDGPSLFKGSDKFQSTLPSDTRKNPQKVQFYKGPCQTKNIFSVCDTANDDRKFTIVEQRYKDYD